MSIADTFFRQQERAFGKEQKQEYHLENRKQESGPVRRTSQSQTSNKIVSNRTANPQSGENNFDFEDSQNRCERCHRPLADATARYGWRCAEHLGLEFGNDIQSAYAMADSKEIKRARKIVRNMFDKTFKQNLEGAEQIEQDKKQIISVMQNFRKLDPLAQETVISYIANSFSEYENGADPEKDDDDIYVVERQKTTGMIPRKDGKKGAESRLQSGDRQRNIGHPEGEEHGRIPKKPQTQQKPPAKPNPTQKQLQQEIGKGSIILPLPATVPSGASQTTGVVSYSALVTLFSVFPGLYNTELLETIMRINHFDSSEI